MKNSEKGEQKRKQTKGSVSSRLEEEGWTVRRVGTFGGSRHLDS